ncbi:MAG: hypothetical protein Q9208_005952 [Pyrenodesmia sp. 3 TL-2023]
MESDDCLGGSLGQNMPTTVSKCCDKLGFGPEESDPRFRAAFIESLTKHVTELDMRGLRLKHDPARFNEMVNSYLERNGKKYWIAKDSSQGYVYPKDFHASLIKILMQAFDIKARDFNKNQQRLLGLEKNVNNSTTGPEQSPTGPQNHLTQPQSLSKPPGDLQTLDKCIDALGFRSKEECQIDHTRLKDEMSKYLKSRNKQDLQRKHNLSGFDLLVRGFLDTFGQSFWGSATERSRSHLRVADPDAPHGLLSPRDDETWLHPILSQAFNLKAISYNKYLSQKKKRKGTINGESEQDSSAREGMQERLVARASSTQAPFNMQQATKRTSSTLLAGDGKRHKLATTGETPSRPGGNNGDEMITPTSGDQLEDIIVIDDDDGCSSHPLRSSDTMVSTSVDGGAPSFPSGRHRTPSPAKAAKSPQQTALDIGPLKAPTVAVTGNQAEVVDTSNSKQHNCPDNRVREAPAVTAIDKEIAAIKVWWSVSLASKPFTGPAQVPYCATQDTADLFASLTENWDLDAGTAESLRRITAEFTWSGERMLIRKGRERDLELVHFLVTEEVGGASERFAKDRVKIKMLLHDNDVQI